MPPPPPPVGISAPAPAAGGGDRSALFSAIQSGARLRKTVTNDRSAAPISGKVVGDTAPPAHINVAAPSPPSPPSAPIELAPFNEMPPAMSATSTRSSNRESVDWYAGLAADSGAPQQSHEHLPTMTEEDEEYVHVVPEIQVDSAHAADVPQESDPMEDVDKTTEYRVRSLFPYEGTKAEDLTFGENFVITCHPSKTGGDWWYGKLVSGGKSGFFPKTYVERFEPVNAKALYTYAGGDPDQLPFEEGDDLSIIDRSEADWWKAEKDGVVFICPAAYLEVADG